MKVREIMTTDVTTASPDMTLDEIATMMRDEDTGAIPVVDEDESLIGIITDRDIVVRCVAQGKDPGELTAEEIMSERPDVIGPNSEVKQASQLMARRQIRRLPVCDNGKLIGMLSLGDLAVKTEDERVAGATLEDVSEGVKASSGLGSAGRTEAKVQGGAKAQQRAGARQGRQQAISNQGAGKERHRQQRVVPIRDEGRPANRRKAG